MMSSPWKLTVNKFIDVFRSLLRRLKFLKSSHHCAQDKGEGSDEEEVIYNPLNLPIGWDGKPIPYWLYRLHGLGTQASGLFLL